MGRCHSEQYASPNHPIAAEVAGDNKRCVGVKDYAMEMITGKLDKALGKLARSTRNNKFVKITYKPGKRISFVNNPIGQREEWEQDIQCPHCFQ